MKGKVLFLILGLGLGAMGWGVRAVEAAPRLTLSPASGSYSSGTDFKVNIGVETDGQKSAGVDVWATFDATKLEVVEIKKIANPAYGFAEISPNINNSTGKFDMSFVSTSMSTYDSVALTGNLAEVTFKAKATGTASFNFVCSKDFIDSNIISSESINSDLIDCASNQSGSYTITQGVGGEVAAPTTSTLPQTGTSLPTVILLSFGVLTVASVWLLRWL